MMDMPLPVDLCTATQNFSKTVMERVISGDLKLLKNTYVGYTADPDKKILKRALSNYTLKEPLTPTEFSIQELNRCLTNDRT